MKHFHWLCLLLLLACCGTLPGQAFEVEGRVRDSKTGDPIAFANVRISGTVLGAVTDKKGHFSVHVPHAKVLLEISHLGYEREYVRLDGPPGKNLDIGLVEKDVEIAPVVIEGGLQQVIPDPKLYVKDYGYWDENLFVLLYDQQLGRFKIAYVNEQDSIVDAILGPEKPIELVHDCYGNVHALGKKFACQLYVVENQIQFYQDSLQLFDQYVKPCIGHIAGRYFYAYRRLNRQILDYYVHNAIDATGNFFYHQEDAERIHQLIDPHPSNIYASFVKSEEQAMAFGDAFWDEVATINKDFQFMQLAFFRPIDAPLRVIGNKVYIFNHLNDSLHIYSADGVHQKDLTIAYPEMRHWDEGYVIVDKERGEAYTRFIQNGWSTLAEIDLETGTLKKRYELPRQFAEKICVRNGVAYFLYKEYNYDDVRRLYRLRIKD